MRTTPTRFLAASLAAALLAPAVARADLAYAFATQTISNLSITPGVTTTGQITSTQAATTVNGSGAANSDPTDTPQAYQGGGPAASQNFFARYAPGNPPVSPVGSFTRADAAIVAPGSYSVVAESLLSGPPPIHQTGNSGLSASFGFNLSANSALTISYDFANSLFVYQTGTGTASANYQFNITIKDSVGSVVFSSQTATTNLSLTAPPPGSELIRSGSQSVTTGTLAGGRTYNINLSSTAQSSVSVAAVPEPSAAGMGLAGLTCLAGGLGRLRRLVGGAM